MPNTPPLASDCASGLRAAVLGQVLALFKDKSLKVFAITSLLICIPLQFYYAFTNLFLNETGVANAASKMTAGQASELFCMLLIPWFFRHLGVKAMLATGMFAWVLRYAMFAGGSSSGSMLMLWGGIILHGICYDFFFVSGQIYIDRKSFPEIRAAAQGVITLITYGVGMLLGSWISGIVVDAYADGSASVTTHSWEPIWVCAAGLSGVVLVLFLFGFRDREANETSEFEQMSGVVKLSTTANKRSAVI